MSDSVLGQTETDSSENVASENATIENAGSEVDDKFYEWTAQVKKEDLIDDLKGKKTPSDFVREYKSLKEKLEESAKTSEGLVKIPADDAGEEEIKAFRSALGVPDSPAKYDLKLGHLPKGLEVSDEILKQYKQLAYESGLTSKQAQALLELDIKRKGFEIENVDKSRKAEAEEAMTALKEKYGDKFDVKISHALRTIEKLGGKPLREELNESGLGNNKELIDFVIRVSENYTEDGVVIGRVVGDQRGTDLDSLYKKSMGHLTDRRRVRE